MRMHSSSCECTYMCVWSIEFMPFFKRLLQLFREDLLHCSEQVHSKHLATAIFHLILIHNVLLVECSRKLFMNPQKWIAYDVFEMAWHWIMLRMVASAEYPLAICRIIVTNSNWIAFVFCYERHQFITLLIVVVWWWLINFLHLS